MRAAKRQPGQCERAAHPPTLARIRTPRCCRLHKTVAGSVTQADRPPRAADTRSTIVVPAAPPSPRPSGTLDPVASDVVVGAAVAAASPPSHAAVTVVGGEGTARIYAALAAARLDGSTHSRQCLPLPTRPAQSNKRRRTRCLLHPPTGRSTACCANSATGISAPGRPPPPPP